MSDENINICINVITKKSIREAGNDLDGLGKKGATAGKKIADSTDKANKSLEALRPTLAIALTGFASLAAIAFKSINAFKAFENGIINVAKVTNISGKQLKAFGTEIDRMANSIPVGTSELLNLAQTAGQLGIQGARDILAFTKSVALLTRTTDLTIDSATSIAQLLAVSKTAPSEIGRLAAVIVDLGNNFSATESQILSVSTRIAQSTTQYNLLAEDAVTLGAVIAGVGEKAEASGTAIGKTFRALNLAIEQGGAPLQKLIDLTGLQRDGLRSLFKSKPTALLKKFTEGLAQAKKEGELIPVILADFGLKTDRVTRVLGPLIKNTDKFTDAVERTKKQMRDQNAATEEAEKQFKSLESAEILAGNATTQLAKTIGTELEPAYRDILETIISVSRATTRFVEDNIPKIKIITASVISLGVALTALSIKLAIATVAGKAFITAITGKIGLAILAVTAVGTAIGGLIVYWDDVRLAIDKVVLALSPFIIKTLNFFADLEDSAKKAAAGLVRNFIKFFDLLNIGFTDIAKIIDLAFGTDLSAKIDNFKKKMEDYAKSVEKGDDAFRGLSKSVSENAEELKKSIKDQIEDNKQKEIAAQKAQALKERIRDLQQQQEDLRKDALKGGTIDAALAAKAIRNIDNRILKLKGLANTEKDQINDLIKEQNRIREAIGTRDGFNAEVSLREIARIQDQITELRKIDEIKNGTSNKEIEDTTKKLSTLEEIETSFQSKLVLIRRVGNGKQIDGLIEVVAKEREVKLKALRDAQIDNGTFAEATKTERILDQIDTDNKLNEQAEKQKQKKIDDAIALRDQINEINKEEKEIQTAIIEIEKEEDSANRDAQLEILKQQLEAKQKIREEARIKQDEAEGKFEQASKKQRALNDKEENKQLKIKTDSQIRTETASANTKRIIAQTTSQQIIGIGENLMKAGILQGKTAGKAIKTLKTAEAIVNTYAGANNAISTVPYPFNIIAAASVIATGLANVATIQSQKFATGGIVGLPQNVQRGIDTVPAQLSVGEEVLTRNNPRHRDNISRDTETTDRALIDAINGLREDMQNTQTIVQIDGKEVADVIQEQRFRGVS